MRILVFSLSPLTAIGGAEVAVKEIIKRLPECDFDVLSLSAGRAKYFFPFTAYREACRRHRLNKYDLVWAIMANQAGMAAALFKRRFPKVPFVLTLQEGDDLSSWSYRFKLLGPRLFGVFKLADRIQAISNYLAQWAREMGARCPIEVIPNGVDFNSFQRSAISFQKNTNEKIIITTSRLVEKNGIGDLIEALRYLPENFKLLVVGSGPLESELKLKADRWQLTARVQFAGSVPPEQIPAYLARADVFVRPSLSEGMGNSFIEAMAAEIPVVGTPVGGIVDFLHEGQTGWFCRVNDPRSIAEKIKFILDSANQPAVTKVVKTARRLVEDEYDWTKIAQRMKILFNAKP